MHLLSAKPGAYVDEEGIIDLEQSPADLIVLSCQDSSLSLLARSVESLPVSYPSVRLANVLHLSKPASLDLYVESVLQHAKVIVVSLLGGKAYWPYGVETLEKLAHEKSIRLILLPGDNTLDQTLLAASNVFEATWHRLWRYLREGGVPNASSFFICLQQSFFPEQELHQPGYNKREFNEHNIYQEPRAIPDTLIYHPEHSDVDLSLWQEKWRCFAEQNTMQRFRVAVLFYRSHVQSGNTHAFDELIELLINEGLDPLPIAVVSLKDTACLETVNALCVKAKISLLINTTGFAISTLTSATEQASLAPLFHVDVPVLQAIMSSSTRDDWVGLSLGLRARDLAMNVALPEMDGRIITRAISFKQRISYSKRSQTDIVEYRIHAERARFVAALSRAWCELRATEPKKKRVALILANYPTKEGRVGNGVGLDTPASVLNILAAFKQAGYCLSDVPSNVAQLMQLLLGGVTNDINTQDRRHCFQSISLTEYEVHFKRLPEECQTAVLERWGPAAKDRKVRQGRIMVAGIRLGSVFVGIQPARGYNLDISASYHDPDLVPPHSYLAFYFWLRHCFATQAIAHVGKHGNMEWLPGKSIALSSACWPEIALGALPHIYPFIVNDPGEGSQAKRRSQAVIIDHLTPPMTRAETYGELQDLERLIDEYYQAYGMDAQRVEILKKDIMLLVERQHLHSEIGTEDQDGADQVLNRLDTYLCELKEAQIRDGLHVLGVCPHDTQLIDTLCALTRIPRGTAPHQRSILHALCDDLKLGVDFDPLSAKPASAWYGSRPEILANISDQLWRTHGDTRERLELLANSLVVNLLQQALLPDSLVCTSKVLKHIEQVIWPALQQSGQLEISNFLRALDGKFVAPGPSGAPTRGRLDVLPTGRNFYSVDIRTIPTPTAWQIAKKSAQLLIQRYMQENGDYPRTLGLSVWGTATMRTGGDDIAQAFALMGVKPVWEIGSFRVIDFEIIPGFILNRPRVDVTLRISGFFRDAFPNVVKLFDAAVKALAALEEPDAINTIRQNILTDQASLEKQGVDAMLAYKQSSWRVFGSKPGAYGAGLQALIDERCWDNKHDLARAYVNWGGYAYDQQDAGVQAHTQFRDRLATMQVVLQNQDNREHDILDSDDYYQFQGGMANAVQVHSHQSAAIYHADHSNPEIPKIRTLKEELNRVIRSRVVNPKWITGMQRHGYKGAFEMAASLDYLFAYDATTDLIDDYQYAMVCDQLIFDPHNRDFLQENNPQALLEMAERLLEAISRGMWNAPKESKDRLESILLEAEEKLETQ